jgi:hypothetical protein
MKSIKSICASICLILPITVLGSPFINGSFELPGNLPQNSYTNLFENNTLLVGWETRGVTYYVNGLSGGVDFPPVDGSYHLNFTSKPNTSGSLSVISQTFDTRANQDYVVTFFVGRITAQSLYLTARVWSDQDMFAVFTARPPTKGYARQQFLFTAKSTTTTLQFLGNPGYNYALDGVTLDAVDVVILPPTNLTQLVSKTNVVGESVGFRLNEVGTPASSYQWLFNGNSIPGETNATLILTTLKQIDAGSYSVIIVNDNGVMVNQELKLVVLPQVPPTISEQPESVAAAIGEQATFRVISTATPAPSFEWFHSAESISGATNSSYSIGSVQAGDAGSYSVAISNPAGVVRSETVSLTIQPQLKGMKLSVLHGFQYSIIGETGGTYTLEASEDLRNWTSLTDVMSTNVTSVFLEPTAKDTAYRFYRVKVK